MSRRIGRILAFQALYSWDVGGVDINDLLTFSWLQHDDSDAAAGETQEEEAKFCLIDKQMSLFDNLNVEKKEELYTFARLLVRGTVENISQIDEIIKRHLSAKWSLERVNKVALAVIRMSVYALLYQKDVPAVIVIDEAVEIVKEYGVDDSHKFTNAILDNINKDLSK
ncbi:MAG: transcription antitermination factor NusB [Treponema sp.]|jgi:N utilization substance protein B|nr:transcription antitermination factor NusB [Treponema sp.]